MHIYIKISIHLHFTVTKSLLLLASIKPEHSCASCLLLFPPYKTYNILLLVSLKDMRTLTIIYKHIHTCIWLQVNCTCTLITGKCFTFVLSIEDLVIIKYLNKFPVGEFNLVINMFMTLNTSSYNSIQCRFASICQYVALKFLTIWTWYTNMTP